MENDIVKIVYFDEGSATDYIQMYNGGSLYYELESKEADTTDGEAGVKAGLGFGTKIQALLFKGYAEANAALGTSFQDDSVMKSVVTNTVLTDFLAVVDEDKGTSVKTLQGLRIDPIPGSISSISLLTPYFSMFRSGQGIPAGELNISVDKLDSTLTKAKGYFEFLGTDEKGMRAILRFNGLAFKNNYKPVNLTNMSLKLYVVRVGESTLDTLSAERELEVEGFTTVDNPNYEEDSKAEENDEKAPSLPMYDVILAGVKASGK